MLGRKIVTVRPEAWRGLRVDYPSAYVDPEQPARGGALFIDEAVVVSEVEPGTPAAQAGHATRHAHQPRRRQARPHAARSSVPRWPTRPAPSSFAWPWWTAPPRSSSRRARERDPGTRPQYSVEWDVSGNQKKMGCCNAQLGGT